MKYYQFRRKITTKIKLIRDNFLYFKIWEKRTKKRKGYTQVQLTKNDRNTIPNELQNIRVKHNEATHCTNEWQTKKEISIKNEAHKQRNRRRRIWILLPSVSLQTYICMHIHTYVNRWFKYNKKVAATSSVASKASTQLRQAHPNSSNQQGYGGT